MRDLSTADGGRTDARLTLVFFRSQMRQGLESRGEGGAGLRRLKRSQGRGTHRQTAGPMKNREGQPAGNLRSGRTHASSFAEEVRSTKVPRLVVAFVFSVSRKLR